MCQPTLPKSSLELSSGSSRIMPLAVSPGSAAQGKGGDNLVTAVASCAAASSGVRLECTSHVVGSLTICIRVHPEPIVDPDGNKYTFTELLTDWVVVSRGLSTLHPGPAQEVYGTWDPPDLIADLIVSVIKVASNEGDTIWEPFSGLCTASKVKLCLGSALSCPGNPQHSTMAKVD